MLIAASRSGVHRLQRAEGDLTARVASAVGPCSRAASSTVSAKIRIESKVASLTSVSRSAKHRCRVVRLTPADAAMPGTVANRSAASAYAVAV